ncbi:MAG: hypothetical protein ACLTW9_20080 [Enterocloster sp.]
MNRIRIFAGIKKLSWKDVVPYSVIQENLRYYDSYIIGRGCQGAD